ncbi:MAG: ATP-binding protein, partial [Thermoleophilia bacterium]
MSPLLTCPSCASDCPEGSRFCPSCGASLAAPASHAVERKVVTTMFCDIVDFTGFCERVDPEDADRVLREFYALARRAIETYGGVVEKFVGDAVVGIFGVPVAHEDDAERAVVTAVRLIDRIPTLPQPAGRRLEVRVGINTGTAVVRLDVVPGSGEGFLVGDAVNTSARLQQLAPPMGVVVGEKTHALTARSMVYEALVTAKVKGKRAAVKCWLAKGPISRMGVDLRQQFPAPLIDREVELGILRGLLKKVRASSQPQFALVVGEAGIGKSRLLFELLRYVDSRPFIVRWRQGRCPAYGDGLTFWSLGEIVKEQLGVAEFDDLASIETKLARALEGVNDRQWLAARLRPLLGLESPVATREENFVAWQRFLEIIAADSTAVIVFEDLHWASEATLAFLKHLVENVADVPMLCVGTARPVLLHDHPDMAAHLAQVVPSQQIVRIDLDPLSESETRELVDRVGRGLGDFVETQRAITLRSAGNPLFAEQLVRHLEGEPSAAGSATADSAAADMALKQRVAQVLPDSLQTLIAARLDALEPACKALLSDAAVVGQVFWTGAVAALDHDDRVAAEHRLEELTQRDLVRRERESSLAGEAEYTFRHALIRDVAYEQLTRSVRAAKHVAVAEWVEAAAADRVADVAEIVAHHYKTALALVQATDAELASSLLESAIRALTVAGDSALGLDVALAERHYARALELTPDGAPQRPGLLAKWGEALLQDGRLQDAASALDEGVRGLLALGRRRAAAATIARSAYAHFLLDPGYQSASVLEAAARLLDGDDPSPELIAVLERWSSTAGHIFDCALAIELADRAMALCAELGLPPSPYALGSRGTARCVLGDAGGLGDLRQAICEARDLGLGHLVSAWSCNLGEDLVVFEGPAAALQIHREAFDLSTGRGDRFAAGYCRELVFNDLTSIGQWDAALADADALDHLLVASADAWDLEHFRAAHALLLALRGNVAEAAALAEWAEESSRASALLASRAACLITLATVRQAQSEPDET